MNRSRFFSLTTTARFRPSPEMNGNGCSASTASGVRIGSTARRNVASSSLRCFFASSPYSRIGYPASANDGRRWSCTGVRPSIEIFLTPFSIWRLSPLIRFMKNSSWSMPRIPAYRTRSSNGTSGSPASSSTRRANCSQLSSRLMNDSPLIGAVFEVFAMFRSLRMPTHCMQSGVQTM